MDIHLCQEQRSICKWCHKTYTARRGIAFYRLRPLAGTVSLVFTLLAPGCPLRALVVACGFNERIIAAWFT